MALQPSSSEQAALHASRSESAIIRMNLPSLAPKVPVKPQVRLDLAGQPEIAAADVVMAA
jgi:hypothetical protein